MARGNKKPPPPSGGTKVGKSPDKRVK